MKLVCGPMATISHRAFRNLIERFNGCDEHFTEMINAGSLLANSHFEKYYIDPMPAPEKIVWQLTGHDAQMMAKAAEILLNLPGIGLDLNMGCSAPDIYKYGAGIAWMTKPITETQAMVQSVKKIVDSHNQKTGEQKRFSVKLRLGDEDFTDQGFFSFTDMLVNEGAELLTLHPRTKKEKLIRPPRYHYAEDLKNRYKESVKIYLNGNIKDKQSLEYALSVCPSVDGIMISRAAAQKPWIFSELKGLPAQINLKELALSFIDDVEKFQPPEFWKTRLQRFFTYYSQNFKFAHYAQTQFLNARDNADLRARLQDFFAKCPEELIIDN